MALRLVARADDKPTAKNRAGDGMGATVLCPWRHQRIVIMKRREAMPISLRAVLTERARTSRKLQHFGITSSEAPRQIKWRVCTVQWWR